MRFKPSSDGGVFTKLWTLWHRTAVLAKYGWYAMTAKWWVHRAEQIEALITQRSNIPVRPGNNFGAPTTMDLETAVMGLTALPRNSRECLCHWIFNRTWFRYGLSCHPIWWSDRTGIVVARYATPASEAASAVVLDQRAMCSFRKCRDDQVLWTGRANALGTCLRLWA